MKSLFESEIGALRSELNQNITAMVSNESFCAGASVALISFAFAKQSSKLLSGAAVALAVFIYLFGFARFVVMRRHTALIDEYMMERERAIDPAGGWAVWYAAKEPRTFPTYKATRDGFWVVLAIMIIASAIVLWAGLVPVAA